MAEIALPARMNSGPRKRRAGRLPDAGDVPHAPLGGLRDPGINIASGAFGENLTGSGAGLVAVGNTVTQLSGQLAVAAERQAREFDATSSAEAELAWTRDTAAEFQRRQVEDDPARPRFSSDLSIFFDEQTQARLAGLPGEVRDQARERLRLRLMERSDRLDGQARLLSLRALDQRGLDTVGQLTNAWAAQLERFPDALSELLGEAEERLADFADVWSPDRERDVRAQTRQSMITAALTGMIRAGALDDVEDDLKSGAYDADIPPAVRAALLSSVEAERRKGASQLRSAVTDAIAVLDGGKVPTGISSLEAAVAGTAFAQPLAEAIEDRWTVVAFNALSVPEQTNRVRAGSAVEVMDRRTLALEQRLARAHGRTVQLIAAGMGLRAAENARAIPPVGIVDTTDPTSLRSRAAIADVASQWAGVPVSPLLPGEANAWVTAIDTAAPGQVTERLASLSAGFGFDGAVAFAGALTKGKRPELAVAVSLAKDKPLLAREIVMGGRLLRELPDVVPSKTERAAVITAAVDNMFADLPEAASALDAYLDAASALYAARRAPTGDLTFDTDTFEQAMTEVMGGPLRYNGRTILPPVPGMDEDTFNDLMARLSNADLVAHGNGVPASFTVDAFDAPLLVRNAQLITSGPGRYLIFTPGLGFVQTATGGAYELDLRGLVEQGAL